eukprot:1273687-Rhodomonas_salina.1
MAYGSTSAAGTERVSRDGAGRGALIDVFERAQQMVSWLCAYAYLVAVLVLAVGYASRHTYYRLLCRRRVLGLCDEAYAGTGGWLCPYA